MKGIIGIPPIAIVLMYVLLSNNPLSNNMPTQTMVVPLADIGDKVYTAEFVHVPLLIKNVKIDVSVKANSYLKIWCEIRIGENCFNFTLNDLSLSYHVENENIQLDGKVSKYGFASFRAIIDTDGIIEGIPKLVLYYIA